MVTGFGSETALPTELLAHLFAFKSLSDRLPRWVRRTTTTITLMIYLPLFRLRLDTSFAFCNLEFYCLFIPIFFLNVCCLLCHFRRLLSENFFSHCSLSVCLFICSKLLYVCTLLRHFCASYLSKEALITQSLLFDSMRIVNFDWIRLLQLTSRGKGPIF